MHNVSAEIPERASEILAHRLFHIRRKTDRAFAILFTVQWMFAVVCAVVVSPRTWIGDTGYVHVHVWASIVVGGLLCLCPVALALIHPGATVTRNVVAVAQMLYSALLIHLTGGRVETHFHVFGSLAFMAFYRDWRIFLPATAVIGVDHLLRGIFLPQSVFGVIVAAPWRAFEHAGWVIFEDVFLICGCLRAVKDLRVYAMTQAQLELANLSIEIKVDERTRQLAARTEELEVEVRHGKALETQLVQAQKLESIGQLASGIAHEINTPMQFVCDNIEFLSDGLQKLFSVIDFYERSLSQSGAKKSWNSRCQELDEVVTRTHFAMLREQVPLAIAESLEGARRVIHIVRAMKEFAHPGQGQKVAVDLNAAVQSTATITRNRWKYAAELDLELDPDLPAVACLPAEINQVLLNLIVNAADAIAEVVGESGQMGQITVRTRGRDDAVVIEVADTGCGIPENIRNRIFDPFFTTKQVGQGSGQGLAICYNAVVHKHQGTIEIDSTVGRGTTFRITLPKTTPDTDELDSVCQTADVAVEEAIL